MPKPASQEKRQDWAEKIRTQQASGLSIEKWCRAHQVKSSVFHYWKETLSVQPPLSRLSFAEIPSSKESSLSIEFHKCRIHFSHFDSTVLRSCLVLLKEVLC